MTEIVEAAREGSLPELPSAEDPTRRGAQRAKSITRPSSVALDAVTQSGRAAWRLTMATVAAADRAGSLADAQPPTFRQARDWHHKCAGHYEALIVRWPRLVWGYAHLLLIVPSARFYEWVTASPIRFAVALAIFFAAWFGR